MSVQIKSFLFFRLKYNSRSPILLIVIELTTLIQLIDSTRCKHLRQISTSVIGTTPWREDNAWRARKGANGRAEGRRRKRRERERKWLWIGLAVRSPSGIWQGYTNYCIGRGHVARGNQYAGTNCQFMLSRYYAGLIIARWRFAAARWAPMHTHRRRMPLCNAMEKIRPHAVVYVV